MALQSKIFRCSILLLLFLFVEKTNAQITPVGKTYTSLVSEACKIMTDGGCMLYTTCILSFDKDSVLVSYTMRAECTPKEREASYANAADRLKKKYKWSQHHNSISIQGFTEYDPFSITDTALLAKKPGGNGLIFKEVKEK